jgi:hypothetical protein
MKIPKGNQNLSIDEEKTKKNFLEWFRKTKKGGLTLKAHFNLSLLISEMLRAH